jgi:metal-responsive CopG/Arc/MetJ family transcriptional regulator
MNEIQTSQKEAIVRFTVDMPESLHQELSELAVKQRVKKAVLVRRAIVQMLRDVRDKDPVDSSRNNA